MMATLLMLAVAAVAAAANVFGAIIPTSFRPRRFRSHLLDEWDASSDLLTSIPSSLASSNIAEIRRTVIIHESPTLPSVRGGDGGDNNIHTIHSPSQVRDILSSASANDQLVVLDFASNNCPPCEMIAPIYADMSRLDEFAADERVVFCKVNVSDHPEVAAEHGVDGWPTFLLFRNGEVVDVVVGGRAAKEGLYGLISKHLPR